MFIWNTYHVTIHGAKIRLDTLDQHGITAGWIVRRACNVFQAFKPPATPPDSGVVDLLADGCLVGQAGDVDSARALLQDAIDIEETGTNPVLNLHRPVSNASPAD